MSIPSSIRSKQYKTRVHHSNYIPRLPKGKIVNQLNRRQKQYKQETSRLHMQVGSDATIDGSKVKFTP